jgi:hypothetical protein
MTAVEIVARRIAPFWLAEEKITGNLATDATAAMTQRYCKADGKSLTQFNTGALVVREDRVIALTECQPYRHDASILFGSTMRSRTAVIQDIGRHGPPLLAVLFRKGAIDVGAWVCCTQDEVVLNGPAGPDDVVAMEDVALLHSLPGDLRTWRHAAQLYAQARADLSKAAVLHVEAARLAVAVGMDNGAVLNTLHHLHRVPSLAYQLAEQPGADHG